mmetsp:Transcript_61094/g.170901  ORF Transcript_61094/g.170901 Transcript_61094/m.170901 type:complete len:921 (+) Transcript_61094:98-2860(+)
MAPKKKTSTKAKADQNEAQKEEQQNATEPEAPKEEPEAPKAEPTKSTEPEAPKEERTKPAEPEAAKEEADEKEAVAKEEPTKKEPVKPTELEEDAPADSRKKISATVAMSDFDSTEDAVVGHGGAILYGMCSDGFQHLLTCSRSTWGLKGGRYMFEFRIVETFGLQETIRVGFSTAGSSLFLSESDESFGFSSVGDFFHGKKRTEKACPAVWAKGAVFGILLNLVEGAPNAFTISLFKDGKRVSKPLELPETFKGKALYPTLTFKNVTLAVDFGGPDGKPTKPLPFAVRMLQDAAAEDAVENQSKAPEKPEALFPVALPDEGAFDFVDHILEKKPCKYVELSDRAVLQWATKSGNKPNIHSSRHGSSNDKPTFNFGNELDQPGTRRTLKALAPFTSRSFVVAEVLGNLTKAGRMEALARFKGSHKCVARVAMGKPPADLVAKVQAKLLKEKERKREHVVEKKRQAFVQKTRMKKAEAARQKRLKAAQKRREEKKEGKTEENEADKDEPMEEKEEKQEEEPEEVFDPDIEGSEHYVPPAALSDEEKAVLFAKTPLPDIAEKVLASKYVNFELPEGDEGFDSIEYVWDPKEACTTRLSKYISDMKLNTPIENLKPSEWFAERLKAFDAAKKELRTKASAYKVSKRDATKREGEEMEKPPCVDFAFEDWALLSIRFELFLLAHAFKKDVDDPERPAMPMKHLEVYYPKYFKKSFTAANFACKSAKELIEELLGSDCVKVGEKDVLEPSLPDGTEVAEFVNLTEEARLDRERRADAGDESATLKFPRTPAGGDKARGGKASGGKGGDGGGVDGKGRNHDRKGKSSAKGSGGSKGKDRGPARPAIAYAPVGASARMYPGGRAPPQRFHDGGKGFKGARAAPAPSRLHGGGGGARPWQVGGGSDRGQKRPVFPSRGGSFPKQQRRL